ncbi:hypothetical protein AB0F11_12915 [Streptomyces sp. NPDC032472]|uniref:hypothetical protein n=1 Tax=Streptomyces sp. NPDC032472 TaxID=3155018 RepID=UPI0033CC5701
MSALRKLLTFTALAVFGVAGCSAGAEYGSGDAKKPAAPAAGPARSLSSRIPHDPPAWFDTAGEVVLPPEATKNRMNLLGNQMSTLPVALHKTSSYVASADRMQTVDLTTGSVRAVVQAQGKPFRGDDTEASAPLVVTDSGTVLTAFLLTQPGSGTQSASTVLEVAAASAESGEPLWRTTVRLPDWFASSTGRVQASVIGAGRSTAVVSVQTSRSVLGHEVVAYGVDLTGHRLAWTQPDLKVTAVTAETAAGLLLVQDGDYQVPVGHDLATGNEKWRGKQTFGASLEPAGASLVRARGNLDGKKYDQLTSPHTGEVQRPLPPEAAGLSCSHDQAVTLVFSDPFRVIAVDPVSGQLLWQLHDGQDGRKAPTVKAVWHGRIYGTTANGAVTLDARTGKDMPTRPEVAPILVNEFSGVVLKGGVLSSYPAGG